MKTKNLQSWNHQITLNVLLLCITTCSVFQKVNANDLQMHNVKVINRDTAANVAYIMFDIQWENAWNIQEEPSNHDAAWVFFKWKENANWKHVYLDSSFIKYPENCQIKFPSDGRGIMVSRSDFGSGNNVFQQIIFKWNYGESISDETSPPELMAFGIEMVYINQGSFYLGSGGTGNGEFRNGNTENVPFYISDESEIVLDDLPGCLWNTKVNLHSTIGESGILPQSFPKGTNAFYCMKYEISQQQYCAFLNTLTDAQIAARRNDTSETIYGHTIYFDGDKFVATVPDRACGYISWADDAAYADWAGLRPMTEFEFEKISRGNVYPIPNQFAWGDSSIRVDPYTEFLNAGEPNESFINMIAGVGNATYHATTFEYFDRPYRCGLFAFAATNKTRTETGGTFYGVMDMSGNLWERTVNVVYDESKSFEPYHGDGNMSEDGFANVLTWPDSSAIGIGKRGGMWRHPVNQIYTSDRQFGAITENDRRRNSGFRAIISDIF